MCRIGVDYMRTVNDTIIKIATSPTKRITVTEARTILKKCGILNKDNRVKNAYKNIVLNSSEVSGEKV